MRRETPTPTGAVLLALCMRRGDFYRGRRWLRMARYVRERDNRTCRRCHRSYRSSPFLLHAHHKLPWHKRRGLAFTWSQMPWNLITLCEDCHSLVHNRNLRGT